jgi:hypothetical protein
MASANTVAQKPAGNVKPLSFEHASLFAPPAALDCCLAEIRKPHVQIAASTTRANNRVFVITFSLWHHR